MVILTESSKPKSLMSAKINTVFLGDCLDVMKNIKDESVDLIYLDPPFFTQAQHVLNTRNGKKSYEFSDQWESISHYTDYLKARLIECKKKLKTSGSLFLHCDKSASHYLKVMLDQVFGSENFQSEIIWTYRRWSNAKKGLLSNHQTIFFYSKTSEFKFNACFENYSPSTNVDQIVQLRKRDDRKKTVYQIGNDGKPILATSKNGVPLGDVWDIPFLNPKANERVGYPTQKPILLLDKIIQLVTKEGDLILDPFCGSGSTLVSAKLLKRNFIGIDQSQEAVKLSLERLKNPQKTFSKLLEKGRASYLQQSPAIADVVKSLGGTSVQRNKGIDGLLSDKLQVIPFKVVTSIDLLQESAELICKSVKKNNYKTKALYFSPLKSSKKEIQLIEKKYKLIIFKNLENLYQRIKS